MNKAERRKALEQARDLIATEMPWEEEVISGLSEALDDDGWEPGWLEQFPEEGIDHVVLFCDCKGNRWTGMDPEEDVFGCGPAVCYRELPPPPKE